MSERVLVTGPFLMYTYEYGQVLGLQTIEFKALQLFYQLLLIETLLMSINGPRHKHASILCAACI